MAARSKGPTPRPSGRARLSREDREDLRAGLAVRNDPSEGFTPLEEVIEALEHPAPANQKAPQKGARSASADRRSPGSLRARRAFLVTVEPGEDGWLVVDCPALPGCMSQGRTEAEALANIQEAIQLCLAARAELGLPLTVETRLVEVDVGPSPAVPPRRAKRR